MAAHGGLRVTDMGPGKAWAARPLIVSSDYLAEFERHVLLGFSGISRLSGDYARKNISNILAGNTDRELSEIRGLADEGIDAFEAAADYQDIGMLLRKGWQLKRRLAEGVSSDWMDTLYASALKAGAFGGKLMGAGGGGFFFFVAPPERHEAIKRVLSAIRVWVPFRIDRSGSQVVFFNDDQPVLEHAEL